MSEQQAFLAMLTRAGIGHGTRVDYNPPGLAVQVEHEDDEGSKHGFRVTEWAFDAEGKLTEVVIHEGEIG